MNILDASLQTPAQANAQAIVTNIASIKTTIFGVLRDSLPRLNQDTLNVFGTQAAALFGELEALITYVTTRLTANGDTEGLAELSALTSQIPAVTINADGTVTINPPVAPAVPAA